MWQYVTLLLALVAVGYAVEGEAQEYDFPSSYVAIMPKILRPGQDFDISLTYLWAAHGSQLPYIVTMLEKDTEVKRVSGQVNVQCQSSVAYDTFGSCNYTEVISFKVDDELEAREYNISISGNNGQNDFFNSTLIKVKTKVSSMFIQTDRAMYKPSQTVKFRVLTVTPDLKPLLTDIDIMIVDKNDNRLKQWLGVHTGPEGVVSKSFELSDEPPLGDWKVKVTSKGMAEEKSFEVAEYVLPKYDVSVDLPRFMLLSDDKVVGSVSAKYTYGQPVKGDCVIKVQMQGYSYERMEYPLLTITKDLIDGKAEFTVTMQNFIKLVPLPTNRYRGWTPEGAMQYRRFNFNAVCTETLTEKSMEKNGTLEVKVDKFVLSFMDITSDNYKPGLSFTAYVQLQLADQSPPSPSDLLFPNGTTMMIDLKDTTYRQPIYPRPMPVDDVRGIPMEKGEMDGATADEVPTIVQPADVANWTSEVDSAGLAKFTFVVPADMTTLNLRASFNDGKKTIYAYRYLVPFKSRDNQGIQVSFIDSTGQLKVGEEAKFLIKTSVPAETVYLQLLSKGELVYSKVLTSTLTEEHRFTLPLTDILAQQLSPKGRVVVWFYTSSSEIISDSLDFHVDGLFANDVSLSFSVPEDETVKPGKEVIATVEAYPGSYVGILAIDQSSLILASGNDITQADVQADVEEYDSTNDYDYGYGGGPIMLERGKRRKRSIWCPWCWQSTGGKDSSEIFKNSGIILLTDNYIYVEPAPRYYPRGPMGPGDGAIADRAPAAENERAPAAAPGGQEGMRGNAGAPAPSVESSPGGDSALQEVERVRTSFPETWLWVESFTQDNGKVEVNTIVPDTITSWVATAFAMNRDKGLGMTDDPAKITVFKPFFVDLDLPYSAIRSEEMELKINVFNYHSDSLNVLVTLENSREFTVREENELEFIHAEVQARFDVAGNDGTGFSVWIKPLKLGNVMIEVKVQSTIGADAVRKPLLVEPEGVEQEYNFPLFIDLSEDSPVVEETLEITLPSRGLVQDSTRIEVTAIGDIMGPAMSNLERLVKMPYGCGEQNMLNFAPNIFVMNYLKASGQDSPDLVEKIIRYTEKGYQKELNYQHKDGSFSAFGESDPSGSTWLTAFVLKSFNEARDYIAVDDEKIVQGLNWLLRQKKASDKTWSEGFKEPGRVIHYDMQGGAASGIALSAYTVITLLELRDVPGVNVNELNYAIEGNMQYLLKEFAANEKLSNDAYTMSIMSYACSLHDTTVYGVTECSDVHLKFDSLAISEDGITHWSKQTYQEEPEDQTYHYEDEDVVVWVPPKRQATATEIETTAYALLTYVSKGRVSDAIPIMKWLLAQRNSLGGYSSTQDTVMALQSLAAYAGSMNAKGDGGVGITIEGVNTGLMYTFPQRITKHNSLVLQILDITALAGDSVVVKAMGAGVALIQISVSYNIQQTRDKPGMNIKLLPSVPKDGMVDTQICVWYTAEDKSGMVVVEANALTGYVATNINELRRSVEGLKRTEQSGKKYIFYFDEITATEKCMTLKTERVNAVNNIQKAPVTAYNYYKPDVRRTEFYLAELQAVCESCPTCCPSGGPVLRYVIDGTQSTTPPYVYAGASATISMATVVMASLVMAMLSKKLW